MPNIVAPFSTTAAAAEPPPAPTLDPRPAVLLLHGLCANPLEMMPLARALRGLQEHYERTAATYRSHAAAMQQGRAALAPKEGTHGN